MKFRKLPIPTPGLNEILLKVKAASINRLQECRWQD
jgi:NADPH:quinone reductase-like Zn-dependent oxidoreductase